MKELVFLCIAAVLAGCLMGCEKKEDYITSHVEYIIKEENHLLTNQYIWNQNRLDTLKTFSRYSGYYDSTFQVLTYLNKKLQRIDIYGNSYQDKGFTGKVLKKITAMQHPDKPKINFERLQYIGFIYTGDKLSRLDFYYPSETTFKNFISLLIHYSGDKIDTLKTVLPQSGEMVISYDIYQYTGNNITTIATYTQPMDKTHDDSPIFYLAARQLMQYDDKYSAYMGFNDFFIDSNYGSINNIIQMIEEEYDMEGTLQHADTTVSAFTYNDKNYPVRRIDTDNYGNHDTIAYTYR